MHSVVRSNDETKKTTFQKRDISKGKLIIKEHKVSKLSMGQTIADIAKSVGKLQKGLGLEKTFMEDYYSILQN